jgi:hypothetical protein
METLTEITQAETARRVRARDFEVARERVTELNRKVAKLADSPNEDTMLRLRRIVEDASELPESVIGSVGGLIPLTGVAGTFISALASSALVNLERADARRTTALMAARQELMAAEEHLATFTA